MEQHTRSVSSRLYVDIITVGRAYGTNIRLYTHARAHAHTHTHLAPTH
jgi:hypothetical protein